MERKSYKLTNPQKSIWLVEQHYAGTNVETINGILNFNQKINNELLEKTLNILIEKNAALRMHMCFEDGEIRQTVNDYKPFNVEILNILNSEQYIKNFSNIKIDLLADNLFYFEIINTEDKKTKLLTKFHHIITDAWSLSLVINEIIQIYSQLVNGNENIEEYYSYVEYIKEEEKYNVSDKYFRDQNYWHEMYSTEPQILTLNQNISKTSTNATRKIQKLDNNIANQIKMFCKETNITTYCFFLTCLQIYISKQYNIEDVIIGNPFLNRKNYKEKQAMGMYINTLPLRLFTDYTQSVEELLKTNGTIIRNALKHQQYPYSDIMEYVKKRHGITQSIYNILFSYQNAQDNRNETEIKYTSEWAFNNNIADNLEIHIHDRDDDNVFNIIYDYQNDVFSEEEIEQLSKRYLEIIKQVLYNTNKKILDIELTDEIEKEKLIKEYSGKISNIQKELQSENIYNIIFKKNNKNLEKISIETEIEKITYEEMFMRINKLSRYLTDKCGVREKENIGIITTKSIDTIIGILAILKINCTIVPIDISYPIERKKYMIANSEIKTILYTEKIEDEFECNIIDINYKQYFEESEDNKNYEYDMNNNIYIVHTSGSTGNPKPVAISHKNIINLIMHEINSKEIEFIDAKILQFAILNFDVSYQEIFTAFVTGSTLVMISEENKKDNVKLTDYIIDKKINILFIPPKYLTYLANNKKIEELSNTLKHIITAGEQLIINDDIRVLLNNGVKLHNHYGPAETHVVTTFVVDNNNIQIKAPIGKPIANTRVYVLDKNKKICPKDTIGEIYIAGMAVGNGYYNKSNLTKERFVEDILNENELMYKTGDIGKLGKDGNIYYLGRADFQVKINGFRIEIEEVEKKISDIEYVKHVSVMIEKDNLERNRLIAFIELNEIISYERFREKLLEKLPQYMIPSRFYLIEAMPLNINGKVDKKQLEKNKEIYKIFTSEGKNVLPNNKTEAVILKCMQKILNTKEINVETDFFEVGGDSLSAIALQIELSKEAIVLNTQEIYDNPSAQKMGQYILQQKDKMKLGNAVSIQLEQKTYQLKPKNNVLLTGATGFLGMHILNELLKKTTNNIYCIVRKSDDMEPVDRLINKYQYYFDDTIREEIDKRVFIIAGDLIKENLGIKKKEYELLIDKIDIVINVAASVKHYGKRDYNYEHNVISTQNILEFTRKSGALLNHISTVGIAGNNLVDTNDCIKDSFSEHDLIIGQNYEENVYVSTKLEAEKLILNEVKEGNVSANILRVGNLMNRYSDNKFQENKTTNAFQNKIREFVNLKVIPKDMEKFTFDLTPVDLCATAVVKLSLYEKYNNVYHVLNNEEISFKDIINILKKLNIDIELNENIKLNNKTMGKWLINDFLLKNTKKILIDSTETQKVLEQLNFKWKNDEKYYINVFRSIIEDEK